MTHAEIEAAFWAKVDHDPHDEERCWPYLDATQRGYGSFRFRDVHGIRCQVRPHRLAYVLTHGEIPLHRDGGPEVDHLCHDPKVCRAGDECPHRRCCNPAHMRLSTAAENGAPDRMVYWQTLKTHCPRGHEYSAANTSVRPNGHRHCKTCNRDRVRAYYRRKAIGA